MIQTLLVLGVIGILCSGIVIGMLISSRNLDKEVEDTHRELYGDPEDWGV